MNGVHISYDTQGTGPALVLINDDHLMHGFRYSDATAAWAQTWHATGRSGDVPRLIDLYMNDPTLGRRRKDHLTARQRLEAILSDNFPIYGVDLGSLLLAFDPPALNVLPTIHAPTLTAAREYSPVPPRR